MKKPHVLNRPMFNVKGNSAYGRGIASNLVTEEQRIRYNSGGRVGLAAAGWLARGASAAWPWLKSFPGRASKWIREHPKTAAVTGVYGAQPAVDIATSDFIGGTARGVGDVLVPDWIYNPEAAGTMKDKWLFKPDAPAIKPSPVNNEKLDKDIQNKLELLGIERGSGEGGDSATSVVDDSESVVTDSKQIDTEKIDLTPSEKAGLQASMWMSGGAGAMDPKNKDVQSVLRGFLTGAAGAGVKAVDPTVERLWRKRGEATKDVEMAKLDKQAQQRKDWYTSPEFLKTEAAKAGKTGADAINFIYGTNIKSVPRKQSAEKEGKNRLDAAKRLSKGDVYLDEETGKIKFIVDIKKDGSFDEEEITEAQAIKISQR